MQMEMDTKYEWIQKYEIALTYSKWLEADGQEKNQRHKYKRRDCKYDYINRTRDKNWNSSQWRWQWQRQRQKKQF